MRAKGAVAHMRNHINVIVQEWLLRNRKHEPVELWQENIQEVVARIAAGIDGRPPRLSDDVELAEGRL